MSRRRLAGGLAPVHVLLLVAVLEVAINRIAVPMLRPRAGSPPAWHTGLDYLGLFLFYFTGTLAAVVLGMRVVAAVRARRGALDVVAHALLGVAGLLAIVPLVIDAPAALSLPLELAFGIAIVAVVASSFGRTRDLGVQVAMVILAVPLLAHTVNIVGARFLWPESAFDAPGDAVVRAGVMALSIAALLSPYVLAPRPFARAVARPQPIVIAMVIASVGAVAARTWYPQLAHAATLAVGIELSPRRADPRLALYLLSAATLAWTLASCALASSAARRTIGMGLALVVLGGYGFRWPAHYLLPLCGLALIAEASRTVRDEELAELPLVADTPPIPDGTWSGYMAAARQGLERVLAQLHTLTTRGEGGLASSVILGDADGHPVRIRIERIDGSVIALDVVVGRDLDETHPATLTLWAIPGRALGANPAGPPATPAFRLDDAAFDERFKARGSARAASQLLDEDLRARVVASVDGWLAYWEHEALRYRVYPGRGAPLDHPLPLSDLALGRPVTPDRLVALVTLLVEIARRGLPAAAEVAIASTGDADPASAAAVDATVPDEEPS